MPPADRPFCCAITAHGARCKFREAGEATLGRCRSHFNQSQEELPAVLAVREFGYITGNLREYDHLIAAILGDAAFGVHGVGRHLRSVIQGNLRTWITANTTVVRDFYAVRAVGTKVDLSAFLASYQTRLTETVTRVIAAFREDPRWAHALGGEPAAPVFAPRAPRAPPAPAADNLAAFAADNQNVHTKLSVELTKTVVARVLKIAVAKEYQWNRKSVSRTPAEIIWACNLHPKVAMQMMEKYCAADNVYEMGAGIYGRVLDGVYAYIKNSPDKKDLYKILRQELTDNLGMCAQGNLTRLCNVLAGYLEGIGSQESPADRLGRELPKLMEIDDETRRLDVARGVLRDTGLPEAEWAPWLEALT
jgi:hypothetical protein